VILHGEQLYVQLALSGYGPGEILFRRVSGRHDYCGGRNHWAGIRELLDIDRLAARLAQELGVELPEAAEPRLVA